MTAAHLAQRPEAWKFEPRTVEDKRIILTGGTTGIGRTTALLLASLGAKVLIFGRRQIHLDEAMQDLQPVKDNIIGITADQADESEVDLVFAAADEQLGGVDILINNAGVGAGTVEKADPDEYRYVIETNLLGYMSCAKRAMERMQNNPGDVKGTIVNIGSMSAESRSKGSDVYVATKMGLRGFCDSLRKAAGPKGIHVCLIEPGKVGADFRVQSHQEQHQEQAQGELIYSEDIAEAVLFCCTTPLKTHIPFMQVEPLMQQAG